MPELLKLNPSRNFYYRGELLANKPDAVSPRKIAERVRAVVDLLKPYGFENVYFYGIDEAYGVRLAAQRPAWEAIRGAGGKIFVSGNKGDARHKGNFDLMGDIQDLQISGDYPSRAEAARWHGKGHRIFSYGNPQGGAEIPDTYRRNYGLLLWQNDYDGAMTYIYHWGGGQGFVGLDFASVWNDVCRDGRDNYKQHNMVYPTSEGVIDTLQWEGYREAATDLRYIALLESLAEKAGDSPEKKQVLEFLGRLKKQDVNREKTDLNELRSRIINYALSLYRK